MTNNTPDNGQLFMLFDVMINGHLQPHLLRDDDCSEIDKVFEECDKWDDEWAHYEYIFEGDDYEKFDKQLKSREKLNDLLKIIPFPPGEKADKYLIKTGAETSKIKKQIEQFIREGADEGFALKQIRTLRIMANQLRVYIRNLGGEQISLFICNTNHFVAHVLKHFIVDLIRFTERIFNLEITAEQKLRTDLFDEIPEQTQLYKIIPFLPEDPEMERHREGFLLKTLEVNYIRQKEGILAIDEGLFRFYKAKYKGLSRESQLKSFKREMGQWESFIIVNHRIEEVYGENFNEPDLDGVLLPMIREEIKRLDSEANEEIIENSTFNTGYDSDQLNNIRKRLIQKKLVRDISKDDFEYLFSGNPINNKMRRLYWKESRPSGHEFLKRMVYHERRFDFNQVNRCIQFADGKLLDSNCKSTAQYKNDDLFNPILEV